MSTDQDETCDVVVPIGSNRHTEAPDRGSPSAETAHLDGRLMHELSALNYQLGRYVLRYYDADAGRADPVPTAEELALAKSVTAAADAIRARAVRREHHDAEPQ